MQSKRIALAFAAIALTTATSAFADNTVTIKNFDYSPMAMTVSAGETVTWKNLDGEPHTVTSVDGLFRSQALDENDTYSFKFIKAGVYKYVCSIHPKMMATITVK